MIDFKVNQKVQLGDKVYVMRNSHKDPYTVHMLTRGGKKLVLQHRATGKLSVHPREEVIFDER